jgi:TfoX/Sxy family transcriptional regulator of competence genes
MSYDSELAERVRKALPAHGDVAERRMMGALCFLLGDHMCCGVTGAALMIRVGRDAYKQTLAEPNVKAMEIGNRRVKGFVLVDADALRSNAALADWILRAVRFVSTLPPKRSASAPEEEADPCSFDDVPDKAR